MFAMRVCSRNPWFQKKGLVAQVFPVCSGQGVIERKSRGNCPSMHIKYVFYLSLRAVPTIAAGVIIA